MDTLAGNDANIKTILNGITQEISGKIQALEANDKDMLADFSRKLAELEQRVAGQPLHSLRSLKAQAQQLDRTTTA